MSLVEKALKKLQESRAAEGGTPPPLASRRAEAPAEITIGTVSTVSRSGTSASHARTDKVITIDAGALRVAGLAPNAAQERRMASEYRQIKRPLIAAALGKRGTARLPNGNVIMVASALPGEGKTFTSINLAMSMALEKDITILLADADLAKPHISRTFGVSAEPGLLDVLRGDAKDIESVIIPTDVRGLSILPAGRRTEGATELLASTRMEQVVAELTTRDPNRIVLFDSPPLLLTSESRVLASVVGQIVIVVRAELTPQSAVVEALQSVGEGRPVGLILNQSESATPGTYYGYGDYGDGPVA